MGELPDLGPTAAGTFEAAATARWAAEWAGVVGGATVAADATPPPVRAAVARVIASKASKTYRYILPTQLLAKTVRPDLDCRALQATADLPGAFDARSLCQAVVVPFDARTENVLGGAPEPYANNPARIPAIVPAARAAQRNKAGFDDLLLILTHAQDNPGQAADLFRLVLLAIRSRLETVRVVYPVPNRVSQAAAVGCVSEFLKERTGGVRLQVIAVALFRAIGVLYGLFRQVRSNDVNAADASTGSAADLECVAADGRVVRAVEVKDRPLALLHVQSKLPALRERGIAEAIFIVQGGTAAGERGQIDALIQKEFATGQNVYVADFTPFLADHLMVFGEDGRRQFLQLVGAELDTRKADVTHRQRWRDLLASI